MDTKYLIVAFGATLIALLWIAIWKRLQPNRYHRRMRGQSKRALKRMQKMTPGAMINYLRKMNPHAVEEIILDAAEAAGHRIRRNRAYTGDGGVDGEIMVDGIWHLVQTKRYQKTISPQHVADFAALCVSRRQPGLFVHCGRTGPKSRLNATSQVRFVSGSAITALITGRSLNLEIPKKHAPNNSEGFKAQTSMA
jgi:restriction system protein